MKLVSTAAAAAILALPFAVSAQSSPVVETAVVEKSTTVVVKEAPKPPPVTFTPYGFILFNAFFNDAAGNRNYPFPSPATGAAAEGNVLFDARQTRLGLRIGFDDEAGWTKAKISGLVEVDFQGGTTTQASAAGSVASVTFYSPVVRLRKAYADAAWGGDSRLTLRAGQDDEVTSPLRAVSLAYVANPLFQFAGVLNGRAPQLALRYDLTPKDGITVSAVAAALNPQDNTAGDSAVPVSPGQAIDLGAGNRSRLPAFQGRVGLGYRSGGKTVANLDAWAGWRKSRYVSPATDTNVDVNSNIVGGDLTLNFPWVLAQGSIYTASGWDQPGSLGASQGVSLSVARASASSPWAITSAQAVKAVGGWFQVVLGPSDLVQVYGGWGGTQSPFSAYAGSLLAVPSTRVQNYQWAAGLIGYAGKAWRFSVEYSKATSWFYTGNSYAQGQLSLNSQIVF